MPTSLEKVKTAYREKVAFGLALLPPRLQHDLALVDEGFTRSLAAALADVKRSHEGMDYMRGVLLGRALGTLDTGCQLGLITVQQYQELLGVLDQLKARYVPPCRRRASGIMK